MNNIEFEEIKLPNPGILVSTIPDDVFQELKQSCQFQIDNKDAAHGLKRSITSDFSVSGIKESLAVNVPPSYKKYIEYLAQNYYQYYKIEHNLTSKLIHTWLNLQQRYEYRPLHIHPNPGLSFVTYISIPYDTKEEDNYDNHYKATVFRNGKIEFVYNTFIGSQAMKVIDIDKSYEGKTIMFLNSFMHVVYPFYTTDQYRISLAGNVVFV